MIIYKAAPYILIIGILFIVLDGIWVVDNYDSYITYPKAAFIYLVIGIGLTTFAHLIIQYVSKENVPLDKDNRVFINRIWRQREEIGNKLVAVLLILLAIVFVFNYRVAVILLQPIIFLGLIGYSFLYIVQDESEDTEEKDIMPSSPKVRNFLRLIDYREHPFNLPLILFIMIVLTFLLSKHFGFVLSLETSGNPRYAISLPTGALLLSELAFACVFIYIIQHCNFFGIRQVQQGEYKLMLIHFIEIMACGPVFLLWLFVLFTALF